MDGSSEGWVLILWGLPSTMRPELELDD